jgi:hypothetical protein
LFCMALGSTMVTAIERGVKGACALRGHIRG